MSSIPSPLRAALGLAVAAVDGIRHLPEKAVELPMAAVSTALQYSLKAQQQYAQLVARGDSALHRPAVGDEPPPWATFDADPAHQQSPVALLDEVGTGTSRFDTVVFEDDEDDSDSDLDADSTADGDE